MPRFWASERLSDSLASEQARSDGRAGLADRPSAFADFRRQYPHKARDFFFSDLTPMEKMPGA